MGAASKIEWTDATWTPIRARVKPNAREIAEAKGYTSLLPIIKPGRVGPHCEHVSPGCENCYSETNNGRCLTFNGTGLPFDRRVRDLVDPFVDEKILVQPLRWRKPRKIFVCSQTDLFGEFVPDEMIDRVFAVMALCPHHTFQCLTKRSVRMLNYLREGKTVQVSLATGLREWSDSHERVFHRMVAMLPSIEPHILNRTSAYLDHAAGHLGPGFLRQWPLCNLWLGVSVENQATADERIPLLLQTPAALRFVSYEPALGPVKLLWKWVSHGKPFGGGPMVNLHEPWKEPEPLSGIDWVIAGGESGPGARPSHPQWFRDIRNQCQSAGCAFFFKQWGGFIPLGELCLGDISRYPNWVEQILRQRPDEPNYMVHVGKKRAGALLDGREWHQFPEVR